VFGEDGIDNRLHSANNKVILGLYQDLAWVIRVWGVLGLNRG
jgi:hypothetical protein